MHYDIGFPHLGINLGHVAKSVSVFGFEIAFYGMIIGAAILIGFWTIAKEAQRTGQNPDDYLSGGIAGIFAGIIGARLYYVIFSWDTYRDNLWQIFNLRRGGLAIYGTVIGVAITALVFAKVKHLKPALIFDTISIGLVNGQMMGRWGNFFNREAFGGYTDSLFAMRLPLDAVRSSDVTEQMLANKVTAAGVDYIQVHPTFLYESLWCMAILVILILYRRHKKYDGEMFLIYVFGYGAGRAWIEGLRTDQLLLPNSQIPVSQLLAALTAAAAGAMLIYFGKKHKRPGKKSAGGL